MPSFKKAGAEVAYLAEELIGKYKTHASIRDNHIKIDFMFANAFRDEKTGEPIEDAIKHHGVRALGVTKRLSLKDRAKGLGDAEVLLDGDWWEQATEEERAALLDHELNHIVGTSKRDAIGRPIVALRQHDHQIGFFKVIAERHGQASQEVQQAARMMDQAGQAYWPSITNALGTGSRIGKLESEGTVTIKTADMKPVTMPLDKFSKAVKKLTAAQ